MNEDIHKWTDGRYTLMFDEHTFFVFDNENDKRMTALRVTKKLNEQQVIIDELNQENADRLGAMIRAQEEWEKCTDKLKEKILEQQATISQLRKKLSECQGHKLELTPIPISRAVTLKEAEDSIRITKYEELFDDE